MSMMRAGVVGAELTESETAVRVFLAAGGLVVVGLLFLALTIWWWRSTKPESPALGPLEVMSDRKWATAAESERRRLLEEHRPEGAETAYVAPVPVDLSVLARDVPSSFDDLRDPIDQPVAGAVDPEAAELEAARLEAAEFEAARLEAAELQVTEGSTDDIGGPSEDVGEAEAQVVDGSMSAGSVDGGTRPSNGAHHAHRDEADPAGAVGSADPADATVAMSRDEAIVERSSDQSFVPHAGA